MGKPPVKACAQDAGLWGASWGRQRYLHATIPHIRTLRCELGLREKRLFVEGSGFIRGFRLLQVGLRSWYEHD